MASSTQLRVAGAGHAEFLGSMPAAYALAFSTDESREHAEIVARRQQRPVHVERWRIQSNDTTVICVVADDRAGLLSLICHALVRLRLEVVSAQIYSRQAPDGPDEAVDFFWVRAGAAELPRPVSLTEVAELERMAAELLAVAPGGVERDAGGTHPPLDPIPAPRAFFDSAPLREGEYLLVVESRDYPGLLLTITQALHRERLEVLSSDIKTQGWLARDRFVLRDSSRLPMSRDRLNEIRGQVVDAVRLGLARFSHR